MPSRTLLAALMLTVAAPGIVPVLVPSLRATAFAAEGGEAMSVGSTESQARRLLEQGVQDYRVGRAKSAESAFRAALAIDASNKVFFQWYLAAGDALLIQMEQLDELSQVLPDVVRRARTYQQELRRDPKYIATLIEVLKPNTDSARREVAQRELVAVGPLAVPQLVAKLGDTHEEEARLAARVILTRMGYRAVLPLCAALASGDQPQITAIATILADVGDPRALPYLQLAIANPANAVTFQEVAGRAVQAIAAAAKTTVPAVLSDAVLTEAQRYLRDGNAVRDEVVANEGLIWRWENGALSHTTAPRYAWNELIAEQLLFDALAREPGVAAYHPLLAATLAAEMAEVRARIAVAKERTTTNPAPEETLAALDERAKALSGIELRLRMFSADAIYGALAELLAADRGDAAVLIMQQLQDRALAKADQHLPSGSRSPDKTASALAAALDHPDKAVRYQAAITLAYLDPAVSFPGAARIPAILGEAVGEWGQRVVLVIDSDFRGRNGARRVLQEQGYVVYTAADGLEAMQRLEEAPAKDAILVAGDLAPSLKDEYGVLIDVPQQRAETLVDALAKDPRSAQTPVFIALPDNPETGNKLQAVFSGKVKGFAVKPINGPKLHQQMLSVFKDGEVPNANRDAAEAIALRAAKALQAPDAIHTQYDLSLASASLVAALENRSDALRLECLKALGNAAQGRTGDQVRTIAGRLCEVYGAQESRLSNELKAAWIRAIGLTDPTGDTAVAIIDKALTDSDAAVSAAAAEAIGHAVAARPDLVTRFQTGQRLDVRAAGNGRSPAP